MAGKADMTLEEYQRLIRGPSREVLTPTMSPAEMAFLQHYEALAQHGDILGCRYRPVTLRLDSTLYTPRFVVYEPRGATFVEFAEKPGALEADPVACWRAAARRWSEGYEWVLVQRKGQGFEVVEQGGT
jgi:hypothetical protein